MTTVDGAQTPPPPSHALTDDLLAVFDQHFLHDGPELLDGFDGLRGKKTKQNGKGRCQAGGSEGGGASRGRPETHQIAALRQLWMDAPLQRQTRAQTRLPAEQKKSAVVIATPERVTHSDVCVCDATFWLSWRVLLQASQRCRGGFSGPSANSLAGSQRSAGNER